MTKSGSNESTRRVLRIARVPMLVVVVAAIGLAGCGDDGGGGSVLGGGDSETSGSPNDDAGGDDSFDQTEPSEDDPLGLRELPDDFPDDFPLPDGYEVTNAIGNADIGFTIGLRVPRPASEVFAEFTGALVGAGWDVESSESPQGVEGPEFGIDAAKGEHEFGILVSDRNGETVLQMLSGDPPS